MATSEASAWPRSRGRTLTVPQMRPEVDHDPGISAGQATEGAFCKTVGWARRGSPGPGSPVRTNGVIADLRWVAGQLAVALPIWALTCGDSLWNYPLVKKLS